MIEISTLHSHEFADELAQQSMRDLNVLKYMAQKICVVLHSLERPEQQSTPVSFTLQGKRRVQHITLLDTELEQSKAPLSFVGFVGERQKDVAPEVKEELFKADVALTKGLASMPGFLYYTSLEWNPGLWYNLVVLAHGDAKEHLRQNAAHRYAAHQLAPNYYAWIRLHSGALPAGLSGAPVLRKTKYFSHQEMEAHFAVREKEYHQ
jgi:hypothetical protein